MSGESVAGLGVAVGVGAAVLLGGAAGASCAFVVGHTLSGLGSLLERGEAKRNAARADMARWEQALHDVAVRNARIGVLAATRDAVGPGSLIALPPQLVFGRQTLAELRGWCAKTDAALNAAEGGITEMSAQAIVRRAAELAGLPSFALDRDAPDDEPAAAARASWSGLALRGDVVRVASRLEAGTTSGERESVARAAQRVLAARSRTEALNRLDDMRVRVSQATAAAAARRSQAIEAARLLQPLAHAAGPVQPLRDQLLQVVAGGRPLTPQLRQAAYQAAVEVQQAADRAYIRRSVTEALAELGYGVGEGFQTAVVRNGVLQVTHGEWQAHGVRMRLDDEKQELLAVVVRTQADDSWDAPRVDAEREAQWCGALEKLEDLLAAKDVVLTVRSVTEPGSKPVPLVAAAPQSQAKRDGRSAAPRADRA